MMSVRKCFNKRAQEIVTQRCLIAADVDKTLLEQGQELERESFVQDVAPKLVKAAANGTHLSFLTGNSMNELSTRVLKWLVEHLIHLNRLELISQFHCFSNSGGVYATFSPQDPVLQSLIARKQDVTAEEVMDTLTKRMDDGKLSIHPRFIDPDYIERCKISEQDIEKISSILKRVSQKYTRKLQDKPEIFSRYDVSKVQDNQGNWTPVEPHIRTVEYGDESETKKATTQITLKPVLSFRYGKDDAASEKLYGKDVRMKLVEEIQKEFDENGLGHYEARPGGRSSIDITLEKLDKAYALEFLIDRLNVQGSARLGQKFGSNTIYFGDEIIAGGGNDYSITRIPGVMAFAVNDDRLSIPFLSHVFVPSAIIAGPQATSEMLGRFNRCAGNVIVEAARCIRDGVPYQGLTALDAFKSKIFVERIEKKVGVLEDSPYCSVLDLESIHAFLTLMGREDPDSRQWGRDAMDGINNIMTRISSKERPAHPAIGTSHPD